MTEPKYRVLITTPFASVGILARDLTRGQAEAIVRSNREHKNSHGKQPEHLARATYEIVPDEGPIPPSRFVVPKGDPPFLPALNADLSVWCERLQRMPRGPFGPIR